MTPRHRKFFYGGRVGILDMRSNLQDLRLASKLRYPRLNNLLSVIGEASPLCLRAHIFLSRTSCG